MICLWKKGIYCKGDFMQAKNIRKTYDNIHYVLNDFSYTFQKGKIYVVKGVSGCGKTTLINILGGIDKHYEGEILYEKDRFAFVTQENMLFAKWTVLENLTFIRNDIKKIENLACKLRVDNLLDKYPKELSGGERQRICIIRALLSNPTVLFADEPAASLDARNSQTVAEAFMELRRENITIIIVSHKNCFDGIADEVIHLDYGKIKGIQYNHQDNINYQEPEIIDTENQKINYAFIFRSLFKKNREQFAFKKYWAMSIMFFLFLACLSLRLNFENEYANILTKEYPADVFFVSSTVSDLLKDSFQATIYENYTLQGDGFKALGLLPGDDSGFYYKDMILFGSFPDNDDEVLVDERFAKDVLHESDYANVIKKTISISGKTFFIVGVVPSLNFDSSNEYITCNVYYQITNDELSGSTILPRVYIPYDAISKIGTLSLEPFKMVKIENLYGGREKIYKDVREKIQEPIFPWDSKVSNIQSALNIIFIVILGITILVGLIAFLFQQNEVKLEYFYRKKEIGGLRLIGVRKGVIFLFLLSERLIRCCCALFFSFIFFLALCLIVYVVLKIWLFIPAYFLAAVFAIVLLYNSLLVYYAGRKILKVDLIQLI